MHEAKDYEVRIWWSAEDGVYVAQYVEMPGIMAHGDTRAAAAASIQETMEFALDYAREDGQQPPAPRPHAAAA